MRIIHWFRRDLRLSDNTALSAAARDSDGNVVPVFVLDEGLLRGRDVAPARVQFMLESLHVLDDTLRQQGSRLILLRGDPAAELVRIARAAGADAVYFNRDYTPAALKRDKRVRLALESQGIRTASFKDLVIFEEDELLTSSGQPFTVFTPFKKAWLMRVGKIQPLGKPALKPLPEDLVQRGAPIPTANELGFAVTQTLPRGGELEAQRVLSRFIESGAMAAYSKQRDYPGIEGTSRLSPHLRFGTISPRQCYAAAVATLDYPFPSKRSFSPAATDEKKAGADSWISELIWREFYIYILYHFPHANHANFNRAYDAVHWGSGDPALDEARFQAWCEGKTGYPIVDAAMRQLNQTGWMHNRTRMIVASFLVKDLLLDWRLGESYFMRMLVDGDPGANNGGWQWAAGTGTDAQPYFRIFNPVLQSERFDPQGVFIRRWVPELARVPDLYIHAPHTMPPTVQAQAGCRIGKDYPAPIVDHNTQKEEILRRFKAVKSEPVR
ncbi:MAG: deoxyribodipyrimidine photo-lyase [Anaerolineae bacterium]|nr:DNA photolyase family protein [Thermoflexales bacterium]MDW8395514.1 deoxyribodipyrimidine photo-lyase [Anaerolineae bacterium]